MIFPRFRRKCANLYNFYYCIQSITNFIFDFFTQRILLLLSTVLTVALADVSHLYSEDPATNEVNTFLPMISSQPIAQYMSFKCFDNRSTPATRIRSLHHLSKTMDITIQYQMLN